MLLQIRTPLPTSIHAARGQDAVNAIYDSGSRTHQRSGPAGGPSLSIPSSVVPRRIPRQRHPGAARGSGIVAPPSPVPVGKSNGIDHQNETAYAQTIEEHSRERLSLR